MRTYLIWSYEHRAWWRAERWGYASEIAEAGWFTREEAKEIELKANAHLPPGTIYEVAIPVGSLLDVLIYPP